MAFSRGTQTVDFERKLYTGVGSFFVKGINLNKKELAAIFGTERDEEPKYVGERVVDGVGSFPQARIDIILATDPKDNNGIEKIFTLSYFVTKRQVKGSTSGKIQVIDKYGRTSWVTEEQLASHAIPVSSKGEPLNLDADYRPVYEGEPALTDFFKAFLNIPEVEKWVDKKVVGLIDNPALAEARLSNVEKMFDGDFSEIKEFLTYQPNNKVKMLLGIRTTNENRQYQTFFTEFPMRNGTRNYNRLEKALLERKSQGAYANDEFIIGELKEFTNTPSPIANESTPQAAPENPWFKTA